MKKMSKLLYWVLKIISILFFVLPIILCLPGLIFHILSEELEEWDINKSIKKDFEDE